MAMSNANLAVTIKRVAQNVSEIVKKKTRLQEQMNALEEKMRKQLEEKLSKFKMEIEELDQQQEIFEKPVREFTGGYGTEDLIDMEVVEAGTDKNGRTIRKTVYTLRYPDTILPPKEEDNEVKGEKVTAETVSDEQPKVDNTVDTYAEFSAPSLEVEDGGVEGDDDLPFSL